jgi:S1-C subfamily serine protease
VRAAGARAITPGALIASVLVAAVVGGVVAAGVTLGILRVQSRTNPQRVDLGSTVTIREDDATIGVAQKAAPAVVSIVTNESTLSHGSGFLVTSDGYIVSNVGVIANAQTLTVLLGSDSKRHDARLVDYDCATGVAVLKVDQVSNLPTLAFAGSSSLRPGQNVVVVGGAFNDQRSVAREIVSALHGTVTVGGTELGDVIQTDPAVDSGLSGAPLLNSGGQVVGVAMSGSSQGRPVGFGLAASGLQPSVQQIVDGGQLLVPSLGVQTAAVTNDVAAIRGGPPGARVTSLVSGGPADRAGLRAGDIVTQLDDQQLDDAHPLAQVLRAGFRPDQKVAVGYARGSSAGQVQLTLQGEHPACG